MRKIYLIYIVMMLSFQGENKAHAATPSEVGGITLENTRVIYPATAVNGITFTLTNHTPYVYLLQSRVVPWFFVNETQKTQVSTKVESMSDKGPATHFIVLPPLNRFDPDETVVLRILLAKNELQQDRESIFTLSLKAIPGEVTSNYAIDENGAKMVLALGNSLKLFYRPEGITVMSAEERSAALQFSRQDTLLVIKNPTPYYVTLGKLKIDDVSLPLIFQRMIAPFSAETYNVPANKSNMVSWQLINDEGHQTPLLTAPLT